MRLTVPALLVVCATLLPGAGHGQFRDQLYTMPVLPAPAPPPAPPTITPPPARDVRGEQRVSVPVMALGGLAGNALGVLVGLSVGLAFDDGESGEECPDGCLGTWGTASLLAGETLGTVLGVHVANGRRGSLARGLLTATGIGVVGALAATREPDVFVVVPLSQFVGAIWVEAATTPRP